MYAVVRQFAIRTDLGSAARLTAGVGACLLLTACVVDPFKDAKVDPSSPVAAEVAKVARETRAYPKWTDIPAMPKDVRAPQAYGRQAQAVEQARADLEARTAPETWSLTGTEGFAAKAQHEAGAEAAPTGDEGTNAFATTLRKRATPPPPPPPR